MEHIISCCCVLLAFSFILYSSHLPAPSLFTPVYMTTKHIDNADNITIILAVHDYIKDSEGF